MQGLADGCFDDVEYFEFESKSFYIFTKLDIPSLEEIEFYGGLRHVKEVKATSKRIDNYSFNRC